MLVPLRNATTLHDPKPLRVCRRSPQSIRRSRTNPPVERKAGAGTGRSAYIRIYEAWMVATA